MNDWQSVRGYELSYEVSRCGDVRKISGQGVGQWANSQGYMMVRLSNPRQTLRVHRLVAAAFIPNPLHLPTVNHINNDRADNRAENLEWCTQAENLAHADVQGRMQRDYWVGKRSPNAKLTERTVIAIRTAYLNGEGSWNRLAVRFGISKRAIGRCLKMETYADV